MNNNLRKVLTMAVVTCTLLGTSSQAFAKEVKKTNAPLRLEDRSGDIVGRLKLNNAKVTVNSPYAVKDLDGSTIIFTNDNDYNNYKNYINNKNNPDSIKSKIHDSDSKPNYGEGMITDVVNSSTKYEYLVGYHRGTPNWAKASSYAVNKGETFSATGQLKWDDHTFTLGVSYTSSVTTTIPADSSQWSKLGIRADILFEKCLFKETKYGEVVNQYYGYRQKTLNSYLDVIYK